MVDDTKNIRMMLTTCLELEGYEVIQAKNAHEAIEVFEKEQLDMAFIDIKMPEISGTELLKRVRGMSIDIPVVIMTAFATVKNAIDCTKLGAIAYLQKPFTSDKVRAVLKDIKELSEKSEGDKYCLKFGEELLNDGKIEEAINILKRALAVDLANGQIYFLLARCYEAIGNKELANKFYSTSEIFGYDESLN